MFELHSGQRCTGKQAWMFATHKTNAIMCYIFLFEECRCSKYEPELYITVQTKHQTTYMYACTHQASLGVHIFAACRCTACGPALLGTVGPL
jgi:hypothetical protein